MNIGWILTPNYFTNLTGLHRSHHGENLAAESASVHPHASQEPSTRRKAAPALLQRTCQSTACKTYAARRWPSSTLPVAISIRGWHMRLQPTLPITWLRMVIVTQPSQSDLVRPVLDWVGFGLCWKAGSWPWPSWLRPRCFFTGRQFILLVCSLCNHRWIYWVTIKLFLFMWSKHEILIK